MQSGIKEFGLTRFSDSTSTCTICDIFLQLYSNQFYGLDVSLCCNILTSNIGLTPSKEVHQTIKSENNSKLARAYCKPILYPTLPLLRKLQNGLNGWVGGKFFGHLFQKKCTFH